MEILQYESICVSGWWCKGSPLQKKRGKKVTKTLENSILEEQNIFSGPSFVSMLNKNMNSVPSKNSLFSEYFHGWNFCDFFQVIVLILRNNIPLKNLLLQFVSFWGLFGPMSAWTITISKQAFLSKKVRYLHIFAFCVHKTNQFQWL